MEADQHGPHPINVLADTSWLARGVIVMDTFNPNCWTTYTTRCIDEHAADVVMLQETKLEAWQRDAAERLAFAKGWRTSMCDAVSTQKV